MWPTAFESRAWWWQVCGNETSRDGPRCLLLMRSESVVYSRMVRPAETNRDSDTSS
jgi:hypothetical protein